MDGSLGGLGRLLGSLLGDTASGDAGLVVVAAGVGVVAGVVASVGAAGLGDLIETLVKLGRHDEDGWTIYRQAN